MHNITSVTSPVVGASVKASRKDMLLISIVFYGLAGSGFLQHSSRMIISAAREYTVLK